MERTVRSAYVDIVERSALDEKRYRVTIAANERIRQSPELDFDGLATESYLRNPVVMWAHDVVGRSPSGGLPIGRTLELTKAANGRIVADFEFLSEDPFAQRVRNAWDKGFLQAASISWLPVESVPVEGPGWRDTRSELLEWSIVAVPADPDALKESHRRMMDEFLQRASEPDAGIQEKGHLDGDAAGQAKEELAERLPEKEWGRIGELVEEILAALTEPRITR